MITQYDIHTSAPDARLGHRVTVAILPHDDDLPEYELFVFTDGTAVVHVHHGDDGIGWEHAEDTDLPNGCLIAALEEARAAFTAHNIPITY